MMLAILGVIGALVYFMGIKFGLGMFAGMTLYQIGHRMRYGHWFD